MVPHLPVSDYSLHVYSCSLEVPVRVQRNASRFYATLLFTHPVCTNMTCNLKQVAQYSVIFISSIIM